MGLLARHCPEAGSIPNATGSRQVAAQRVNGVLKLPVLFYESLKIDTPECFLKHSN